MSHENPYFLSRVLDDAVGFLLADDWEQRNTKDGREYYVLGWNAYLKDTSVSVEVPDRTVLKWSPQASSDKYMRAVLAERPSPVYSSP